MSILTTLLDRLRRAQFAPGAPAGVVGVPAAAEDLTDEVSFMFGRLDELEAGAEAIVSAARAEAAEIVAAAEARRRSQLDAAHARAERVAEDVIAERRVATARMAAAIVSDAERAAEEILARGRARTPALVDRAIVALLGGAR